MIPFNRTKPRRPFDAAGRFSRVRAEEHCQPRDGAFIIVAFSAHVTDPGREMRDGDQFLSEPGEVCDVPDVHDARGAFIARDFIGYLAGRSLIHVECIGHCAAETCLRWSITSHLGGGQ